MFGTVARIRVKAGKEAELARTASDISTMNPPGWVSSYVLQSKDDPQEKWLVAIFESEQAYYDNASRPETSAQYEKWMEIVEAPPEWHDVRVESVLHAKG